MKLAAIVPIGPLDDLGYQHVARPCLENLLDAFQTVHLVDSVNQECPDWLESRSGFWWRGGYRYALPRQPDGSFWFDAHAVMENVNLVLPRTGGADAVCVLMINNYVRDRDSLCTRAEQMLTAGTDFTYYYRADQLADRLLGPSVGLPWVINLRTRRTSRARLAVDSLALDGRCLPEPVRMVRGDYSQKPAHVVDVQLEMTAADFAKKQAFIRNYADLVPKRQNWPYTWAGAWRQYYLAKFASKPKNALALCATGREIAAGHRPDFLSAGLVLEVFK